MLLGHFGQMVWVQLSIRKEVSFPISTKFLTDHLNPTMKHFPHHQNTNSYCSSFQYSSTDLNNCNSGSLQRPSTKGTLQQVVFSFNLSPACISLLLSSFSFSFISGQLCSVQIFCRVILGSVFSASVVQHTSISQDRPRGSLEQSQETNKVT